MLSVDLETLFCSRSKSKLFVSSDDPTMIEDPDLPPESVQLPIHNDIHWIKLNKVFDRGQSTIGNANPKSSRTSSKPKSHSQRLKPPNGPILGLPNAAFHANGSRPLPAFRIFPLNYSIERKPAIPDPGSPKVSCFGSVLADGEKKVGRRDEAEVVKGEGCWAKFALILGFAGFYPAVSGEVYEFSHSTDFSSEEGMRKADSTAPGLQGMKRFSSGRRSGSWADDLDRGRDGRVVLLEPLDREGALQRN